MNSKYRQSLRILGIDPNTSISDVATRFNIRPVQYSRPYVNGRMVAPISFGIRQGTPLYNNFIETDIINRVENSTLTQIVMFECETFKKDTDTEWKIYRREFVVNGKLNELERLAIIRAKQIEDLLRKSDVEVRYATHQLLGHPKLWLKPVGKTKIKMKMGKSVAITEHFPKILKMENTTEEWNTGKGECVQDYLTNFYKDEKGFKKMVKEEDWLYKIIDAEKIINLSASADLIKNLSQRDRFVNLKEEGVSIDELKLFCDKADVNMYAFDADNNCIEYYRVKNQTNKKPLMFYCMNAHIYPIENKDDRKAIASKAITKCNHSNHINNLKYDIKEKDRTLVFMDTKVDEEGNEINYTAEEVNEFMLSKLYEYGLPTPSSNYRFNYEEGRLTMIDYDKLNVKIFGRQNDLLAKYYCMINNIKFQGQTLSELCYTEFNRFNGIEKFVNNKYISNYNPLVFENLLEAKKSRSHIGLIDVSFQETEYSEENPLRQMINDGRAIAYDIEKCYSSVLMKPFDKWIVYDYKDEITKFQRETGFTDGELKTGLYYVKTNDTTLFKKSNWYSNKIIELATRENIEFKIKRQIIPSKTLDNEFDKFIKEIYIKSGYDAKTTKRIINNLTGLLGKTNSTKNQVNLTTNEQEKYELLDVNKHNKIILKDLKYDDDSVWIFGYINENKWLSNCLPMYLQILDWSNIKLYEMTKQIGGIPVYRKVDMVVCIGGKKIKEPSLKTIDTWGSYRYVEPKEVKMSLTSLEQVYPINLINNKCWYDCDGNEGQHFFSSNQAEEIFEYAINNGGALVRGSAGTGKSTIINKIQADKFAPTNASARNIKGMTYHRGLGLGENGLPSATCIMKYKNQKVLVADEIGMWNWEGLIILMTLKQLTDITIICFGDFNQLTPVENDRYFMEQFSYENHSILKYICGGNRITLTENFRQREQPEFIGLLKSVLEDKTIPDLPSWKGGCHLKDTKNIVFFNKTRDYVNDMIMNEIKPNNAIYIPYERNEDDEKPKSLYLFKGLKLMAYNNRRNIDLINSDEFIVSDYNETTFTIENEIGETKTLPLTDIHKHFVVNYASTIYKNQGLTIKDPIKVVIYDWAFQQRYKRVLYTILTRVQKIEQLYIA